ncbi:rhomboid family intramembrane serine protease [Leptospira borgpetersenii]|nr:rhomboid family intramembrane serine protease [Leptospira borgpetersenii]AMX57814.1 peptidase S54 [Leptospira borgpetersenii serovar Hardjo]AMX61047.1 peptidase S54 [Leptospira borgpetersenii serovar Hardjo]AMX64290.1 peptidase S54 [Leptospira borgpetersenii serovar Hardjo]AMX67531.1 peptidase S54 [Leptospira borgpetersenii serovar Hardjo]AMX71739.1 peptidase S54 [Leptospira borgpetersenii serovar Hardjo]
MAKRKYRNGISLFGYSVFHPINLLLIANVFVYIMQLLAGETGILEYYFALTPSRVFQGYYWQIFSYGFLHEAYGIPFAHLFFNMYVFVMFGGLICKYIPSWKFTVIYVAAVLMGGISVILAPVFVQILGIHYPMDLLHTTTLGASGGVTGILVLFGILFPETEVFLIFFRMRARYAAWIFVGGGFIADIVSVYYFHSPFVVSNSCHLGGAIGAILVAPWILKDSFLNSGKILLKETAQKNSPSKPKVLSLEEDWDSQTKKNRELLNELAQSITYSEKKFFLTPLQQTNVNLCPPPTFQPKDPFCLRCEWFPNCALRKLNTDQESDFGRI